MIELIGLTQELQIVTTTAADIYYEIIVSDVDAAITSVATTTVSGHISSATTTTVLAAIDGTRTVHSIITRNAHGSLSNGVTVRKHDSTGPVNTDLRVDTIAHGDYMTYKRNMGWVGPGVSEIEGVTTEDGMLMSTTDLTTAAGGGGGSLANELISVDATVAAVPGKCYILEPSVFTASHYFDLTQISREGDEAMVINRDSRFELKYFNGIVYYPDGSPANTIPPASVAFIRFANSKISLIIG